MNPLFKNATRAIKAAIRAEFRTGKIAQLMRRGERMRMRKGAVAAFRREVARKIHGPLAGRTAAPLPGFERYAKKRADKEILEQIYEALGPLGKIIQAMTRPHGVPLKGSTLEKEQQFAVNFLRAYGFAVTPPPKRKAGTPGEVKAIAEHLGKLGFKVVPTSTTAGFPVQAATDAPRGPKPLPGWAQRAHTQQAKPQPENRPPRVRKTIDINFGDGKMRRVKLTDPIVTGEMIKVVSSNVYAIGFEINTHSPVIGTLKVRFWQSEGAKVKGAKVPGALYYYYNVPTDLFRRFQKAASKGKFVWDNLRIRGTVSGHKFDYALQGIAHGYVPRKATLTAEGEIFAKRHFLGENTKTGERRLFHSRESAMVRPFNGRPGNGRPAGPNRGR